MELLDFFDLTKKFDRVCVAGSQTKGQVQVSDEDLYPDPTSSKGPLKGQDYAKDYQEEEARLMVEKYDQFDGADGKPGLCDIEELTSVGTRPDIDELQSEELTKVYDTYSFDTTPNTSLPISAFKSTIISTIETNQITVIKGATGCGKTTQVPQYILDSCYGRREPCNIIITQPRRIAAITVAKRVCQERNWPLGGLVGYQVGLNNKTSDDTRMTFCTTGILLQKLIHMKNMNCFTHVILDEVHERDQDTDFALLVVRKLLRTNSSGVKVILMSATFNISRFCSYFSQPLRHGTWVPAPHIDLEAQKHKRHTFHIHKYYLCQLSCLGEIPEIRLEEPGISPLSYQIALRLIQGFDHLEQQGKKTTRGAVLIFLPGIYEIEELYNMLYYAAGNNKWILHPLHSTVTTQEQEAVFYLPRPGYRKIILSTNIAESSLTVPDVVYVIDFCLTKELVCDPTTNFTSLQVVWASKTNCIQRAGRSGRVCEGRVYRLVPRDFYENFLEEEGKPEILRCPLERVVLQAKLLDMGEPKALLALSLDPPNLTNLENTILILKEVGALLLTVNGEPNPHDGDITYMGRIMAKLPVDIHVTKLIVLGHIFSVLEECIIMGAAMSLKSLFSTPFKKRLEAYHSKLNWADGSCSDCIALLNAFQVWRLNKQTGFFNRSSGSNEEDWANRFFIQIRTMHDINVLYTELKERLKKLNIEESVGQGKVNLNKIERSLALKVVLAGAFYPHYFVRGSQGGQVDEREAVRQLDGRDPKKSVFLQGMPMNQPGELYVKSIKNALKDCADDMVVSFDGSSKVYVQFGHYSFKNETKFDPIIPGQVSMAVYRAVKLRQLKIPIQINMIPPDQAFKRARELGLLPLKDDPFTKESKNGKEEGEEKVVTPGMPNLPSMDTTFMPLVISHVIDAGHFWVQSTDGETMRNLEFLNNKLNIHSFPPLNKRPRVGDVCIAPFERLYYRARVDAIHPNKTGEPLIQVFFLDFGNTEQVKCTELKSFGNDKSFLNDVMTIAPLAFECVLCEIKPSLLRNPRGLWTEEANQEFRRLTLGSNKRLYGKIYSVVNGVVSMELLQGDPFSHDVSASPRNINKILLEKGYAEPAEEGYLSKHNHELREQQGELEPEQKLVYEQQQIGSYFVKRPEPEPPTRLECDISVTLKGPFSPLEMKVYNITQVGSRRTVIVEWNSVNSVLLDTDPQDPHERLLVAACVGQNPQGDRLTLRHTSLLPNMHGLAALLCLIFSPAMELRVNKERTRYTGAICGLGPDPKNGHSMFQDHDMEVTFDTEINLEDILNINRLRFWMSFILFTPVDSDMPEAGPAQIANAQKKVKEFFFKLVGVSRKSVELDICHRPYTWDLIPEEYKLHPGEVDENARAIFRLHSAVQLRTEHPDTKQFVENIRKLHLISGGKEKMPNQILCMLCEVELTTLPELRIHLSTLLHRGKEKKLHAPA